MKISSPRNLRIAPVVLFYVSLLLAPIAKSTAVTSNLNLEGIQSAVAASDRSDASQSPGIDETTGRAMPVGPRDAALPSLAMFAPSPEWSVIFPIIGLIAAVAVTQLLRRRRIAQLRSSSSTGH